MTDPGLCGHTITITIEGQSYTGVCKELPGHYPNTWHANGIFTWSENS